MAVVPSHSRSPTQTEPGQALLAMVPRARQLGWPLVVNGLLPLLAYVLVRPHVRSDTTALLVVLVFPLADVVASRLWGKGTDPIAVITLVAIGLTLLGMVFLSWNALLLKIRPSAVTTVFGLGCLVSLGLARPALFYLGRAFATSGDRSQYTQFEQLLGDRRIAHLLRRLSGAWGAGLLIQAATNIAIAILTSTKVFLVASLVVDWVGLGVLLFFTSKFVQQTAVRLANDGTADCALA